MPRVAENGSVPSWDQLWETASSQAGFFNVPQAAEAGFSRPLLQYHVQTGKLERWGRGILRLTRFPPSDNEDLVPLWLWADRKGVFSHETALALHDLSDALPGKRHLTVPESWSSRRLRVPAGLVLHHAAVPKRAIEWKGPVTVTSPLRTIVDCKVDAVAPDLLKQAIDQGVRRGHFTRADVRAALKDARA